MNKILIKPLITEKSMIDAGLGRFTFLVALEANKNEIAKEVQKVFKVTVLSVKTSTFKGKAKQVGAKRQKVAKKPWKKAIVALLQGEKIDLFDVVGEQK